MRAGDLAHDPAAATGTTIFCARRGRNSGMRDDAIRSCAIVLASYFGLTMIDHAAAVANRYYFSRFWSLSRSWRRARIRG
jgi:hypothetical protein